MNLLMVASELNVSDYINPKASLFLQLVKSYYWKIAKDKLLNKKKAEKPSAFQHPVAENKEEEEADDVNEDSAAKAKFLENIKEKLKIFMHNN